MPRDSLADLPLTLCAYRCCCKFTAIGVALALCIEPENGELERAGTLDLDKSARCMLGELGNQKTTSDKQVLLAEKLFDRICRK